MSERLLLLEELPMGPLDRYIRDIYNFAKLQGYEGTFEQYKEQYNAKWDTKSKQLEKDHPTEFDSTVRLDDYSSLQISKRKGKDWRCYVSDMTPNYSGRWGYGEITLVEALKILMTSYAEGK